MRFFSIFVFIASILLLVQATPIPSFRSTVVTKILGPELDEIRQHLQIVPEIRSHIKDVVSVVHDIKALLTKLPTANSFMKRAFV